MSDEAVQIESKEQLKEVLGRTKICILVCKVEGRDGLNFSAQEELDDALENKARDYRTFATINGSDFQAELKELGVDLADALGGAGMALMTRYAIFADGKVRIVEDTPNVTLSDLIGEYGQEDD